MPPTAQPGNREPASGLPPANVAENAIGHLPNVIEGGLASAGNFLDKASGIFQFLDNAAQLGALGASEALQTKQEFLKVLIYQ